MEEVFLHMAVFCYWISNHGKYVANIIQPFKHGTKIYSRQVTATRPTKYCDLQLTKHAHVACVIWMNASSGIILFSFFSFIKMVHLAYAIIFHLFCWCMCCGLLVYARSCFEYILKIRWSLLYRQNVLKNLLSIGLQSNLWMTLSTRIWRNEESIDYYNWISYKLTSVHIQPEWLKHRDIHAFTAFFFYQNLISRFCIWLQVVLSLRTCIVVIPFESHKLIASILKRTFAFKLIWYAIVATMNLIHSCWLIFEYKTISLFEVQFQTQTWHVHQWLGPQFWKFIA